MKDFEQKAQRPEAEKPSLAGYVDFAFGEGQQKDADPGRRLGGGLASRKPQRIFFPDGKPLKPDCLSYSAHFRLDKDAPSEEMHKKAILELFKDMTILKAATGDLIDAEDTGERIRTVSVQLRLEDLEKAREVISKIDAAGRKLKPHKRKELSHSI
jgi:hypothetical protein